MKYDRDDGEYRRHGFARGIIPFLKIAVWLAAGIMFCVEIFSLPLGGSAMGFASGFFHLICAGILHVLLAGIDAVFDIAATLEQQNRLLREKGGG